MVAGAERNFAKAGLERGIRASFLDYFAEDSIIFAPGTTSGKAYYTNYKEKGLALIWQPAFATIAVTGDLGVTTGPWEIKKSPTDTDAIAFGEFVSVWKLQRDKSWKVVFDTGIDHAGPARNPTEIELVSPTAKALGESEQWDRRMAFVESVRRLNDALENKGAEALIDHANDRIRILREDSLPIIGKEKAKELLAGHAAKITRQMIGPSTPGAPVSPLADLAYGYGSYSQERGDGTAETEHFVTVWRISDDGNWKVVIDLQKKTPPAGKK